PDALARPAGDPGAGLGPASAAAARPGPDRSRAPGVGAADRGRLAHRSAPPDARNPPRPARRPRLRPARGGSGVGVHRDGPGAGAAGCAGPGDPSRAAPLSPGAPRPALGPRGRGLRAATVLSAISSLARGPRRPLSRL